MRNNIGYILFGYLLASLDLILIKGYLADEIPLATGIVAVTLVCVATVYVLYKGRKDEVLAEYNEEDFYEEDDIDSYEHEERADSRSNQKAFN